MRGYARALAVAALVAAMLASFPAFASAATVFADEFTSGPLNTGAWKVAEPWGTQWNNREQQWYDPANLLFGNGEMRIKTEKRTTNGYPYASGIVTSKTQYSYGYYEMRAKLPKTKGVWPAFWLLHDGTATEPHHEIDVMELLGDNPNKVYMTYHLNSKQVYQSTYTGPDFSAGYHTFAVDWQPSYIRWYVDGVQRGEYLGAIPSLPQNIIANTAVGDSTSWPGAPDATTALPQYYDIDYIRVFPAKADATPVTPPAPAPTPTPTPTPVPTPTPTPAPVPVAPPVAAADSFAVDQDSPLTVAAPGVLANDDAPSGAVLTASLAASPARGTVALNADGSFIYTPRTGFSGTDTFSYRASDGVALSPATPVTISVRQVPHTPVAVADRYSTRQGTALTVFAPGLLANDADGDGDALRATLLTAPAHGTVSLASDGSFVYTPATGFSGADAFTYTASDGTLSSPPASVGITVDPAVKRGRAHWRSLLTRLRLLRTSSAYRVPGN